MLGGLNGGFFWHSVLRCFFGELGDKTFFITLAFAAWCPWVGVRDSSSITISEVLVFLGALCAFYIRIIVLEVGVKYAGWLTTEVLFASTVLLLALAAKARMDLGSIGAEEKAQFDSGAPDAVESSRSGPAGHQDTTQAPPQRWAISSYGGLGSMANPIPEHANLIDGATARYAGAAPTAGHLVFAFVVPLVTVFLAEAWDRSEGAVLMASHLGADAALSAMLGCLAAVLLAITAGFLVQRTLSDQQLLFAAVLCFSALSLVSLSQALLSLGGLSEPGPVNGMSRTSPERRALRPPPRSGF